VDVDVEDVTFNIVQLEVAGARLSVQLGQWFPQVWPDVVDVDSMKINPHGLQSVTSAVNAHAWKSQGHRPARTYHFAKQMCPRWCVKL
jgi:hypothetical protein